MTRTIAYKGESLDEIAERLLAKADKKKGSSSSSSSKQNAEAVLRENDAHLLYLLLEHGYIDMEHHYATASADKSFSRTVRCSLLGHVCRSTWLEGIAICMYFGADGSSSEHLTKRSMCLKSPVKVFEDLLSTWGRDPNGSRMFARNIMPLQRIFYLFTLVADTFSPHAFPSCIADNEYLKAVSEAPQCAGPYAEYMASVQSGFTPLMYAARFGCMYGVRLLIDKYGVNPDARDQNGKTAAEEFGASEQITQYIREAQTERREWLLAIGMAGFSKLSKSKQGAARTDGAPWSLDTDLWDRIIRIVAAEKPGAPRVM